MIDGLLFIFSAFIFQESIRLLVFLTSNLLAKKAPASHEIDGVRKEKERLTAASIIDIFQAAHEPFT